MFIFLEVNSFFFQTKIKFSINHNDKIARGTERGWGDCKKVKPVKWDSVINEPKKTDW